MTTRELIEQAFENRATLTPASAPRELLEQRRPPRPLPGEGEEPADLLESATEPLARLAGHSIELVRVESERPILRHCVLLTAVARCTSGYAQCALNAAGVP